LIEAAIKKKEEKKPEKHVKIPEKVEP